MSGGSDAFAEGSLWSRMFRLLDGRLPELEDASTEYEVALVCRSGRCCVGLAQAKSGKGKIRLDFWISHGQTLDAAVRQASEILNAIMEEIPSSDWARIAVLCRGKHSLGRGVVRSVTESLQCQFQDLQ